MGVETYTFSKTFNMAGWRFGFAVGNASIIRAFKKLHTHSYSTVFGAIQDAAIAALNLPAERITQLTAVYHQRREWVLRRLAALRWPARDAQGTFFLWLGVPPGYRSQEFARLLLQEAHILVAPGTGFGAGGRIYSHQPDRRGRGAEQRAGPSCPAGAVLVRRREKQKRNPRPSGITRLTSPSPTARFCPQDAPALLAHAPSAPAQGENAVNCNWMTPASSRSASRASCAPLERTWVVETVTPRCRASSAPAKPSGKIGYSAPPGRRVRKNGRWPARPAHQ